MINSQVTFLTFYVYCWYLLCILANGDVDKEVADDENYTLPALEIEREEEPDESDISENPYILSKTLPVGPNSFID